MALLAAAVIVSFWPVLHAQFINYDDNEYVTENPWVQGGLSWPAVAWAFKSSHASNWHPITWLSHMLDTSLFGHGPMGPHVVNLGFHVANTLLVYLVFHRITGARWKSAFVAGLFGVHPLHVESVAWVAERKDVLSGFFFLLTLWLYAKYVASVRGGISIQKSRIYYLLALALFALGLMSKPMLVTMPFVLLLLDYWPFRRVSGFKGHGVTIQRLLLEKAPFFVLSGAACWATVWAQTKAILSLEHLPLWARLANAVVAYAAYVVKTFWPARLALPYLHQGQWPALGVIGACVLIGGITILVFKTRSYPYVTTGWLWFLGMLMPVNGLVQVGAQAMADRYTYLPLIGLFIVFVWGAAELCARWNVPASPISLAGCALLLACAGLTFRQAGYWKDSETLFKHTDAVTRDNFIAVANVGGVYFESGRLDQAMQWYQRSYQMNPRYADAANSIGAVLAAKGADGAIEWFKKALELQPGQPQALFNMGNALAKRGDTAMAAAYYKEAAQTEPDNYEALNNLGNALLKLHRFDDAILEYEAALRVRPREPLIHKNLGEAFAAKGRLEEAIGEYRKTLVITNDAATHYALGLTFAVQAKWNPAIEQFAETVRLSPTNGEAQYNLGYAFVMTGKPAEAERHLREAVRFRPDLPLAHYHLGCVLAEQGRKGEAIPELREALREKRDYVEAAEKLKAIQAP